MFTDKQYFSLEVLSRITLYLLYKYFYIVGLNYFNIKEEE